MVYAKVENHDDGPLGPGTNARAGIVVPKREIPLAVDRNAVKRKLRHLLAGRLADVPTGTRVVVRGLRSSSKMTSQELAGYLDRALSSALKKEAARG